MGEAYERLRHTSCSPAYPAPGSEAAPTNGGGALDRYPVSLADLIAAGILAAGAVLFGELPDGGVEETLLADDTIEYDGEVYYSVTGAQGCEGRGRQHNGWNFWRTDAGDGLTGLHRIRRELAERGGSGPADELEDDRLRASAAFTLRHVAMPARASDVRSRRGRRKAERDLWERRLHRIEALPTDYAAEPV